MIVVTYLNNGMCRNITVSDLYRMIIPENLNELSKIVNKRIMIAGWIPNITEIKFSTMEFSRSDPRNLIFDDVTEVHFKDVFNNEQVIAVKKSGIEWMLREYIENGMV